MQLTERGHHYGTLYVHRPLLNAKQLLHWATEQGFPSTLQPHDMHVTVAFSKQPVPWHRLSPLLDQIQVLGGPRHLSPLGDKGAVVLHFDHPPLSQRWHQFLDAGASWEHEGFRPHVTLTYDGGSLPLHGIQPYSGPLIFGPEKFAPLDMGWDQKIQEVPLVVEKIGHFPQKRSGLVKYGESSIMEKNRMTELSTLLMKNIDLILEAYNVDQNGSLIAVNKKKVAEADEVFHDYFVKSMNQMFRRLNENDPIMTQPDGMGMMPHGHDDLGIGHEMMDDMSPMGHPHHEGHHEMMMPDENDMTGMYPHHMMHADETGGMPGHMGHHMGQFESADTGEDWFNEDVEDLDINEMFDITEDEEQIDEMFPGSDDMSGGMGGMSGGMGGSMDMGGGANDFGGDMGGMGDDGGDNMDLDSSLDMGGGMGSDEGDMITIHGETDSGSPFEFKFDPNTLGFGDDMGGGDEHGHEGHEHHGHEDHGDHDEGSDIAHPDEPGMGDDDQPPVAEAAFHNGKPRRTGKKVGRMSVVPANPKVSHAAPFPTPMFNRQK